MKKIFAICAVAFVAAAMFTSCNKPEDNAMTVKFNKEQWTAQQVLGNQVESILGMEAYETNYEDANCASVFAVEFTLGIRMSRILSSTLDSTAFAFAAASSRLTMETALPIRSRTIDSTSRPT